jgi:uncharacterized integral membrane protein
MKPRTWAVTAVAVAVGVFAALNWQTFAQPAPLDLLVAQVDAPLGMVMLLLLGAVTVLYMLLLARVEIAAMLESGRLAKELERVRRLADSSEESRIQALREHLDDELSRLQKAVTGLDERLHQAPADGAPGRESISHRPRRLLDAALSS